MMLDVTLIVALLDEHQKVMTMLDEVHAHDIVWVVTDDGWEYNFKMACDTDQDLRRIARVGLYSLDRTDLEISRTVDLLKREMATHENQHPAEWP